MTKHVYLDERTVADQLGVTTRMLQARRWRGLPPRFVKIGRLVRYSEADIADWVRERTVDSTSAATGGAR